MNIATKIFSIIILIFLCRCKTTGVDDNTKRNENWCWFVDKKTNVGEWIPISDQTTVDKGDYTLFFNNGKMRRRGKLKNGKDCDTIFTYDINERIVSKIIMLPDSTLKEFMPDGKYKGYYPTCELACEGEAKNNQQIGVRTEYFKSGKVKLKSIKNNDTVIAWHYFESGILQDSITRIKGKEEGLAKNWYTNGNLEKLYNFKNGLMTGLCINYYENGQIETQTYFSEGKENGLCISYFENSKIKNEGTFKNGVMEGQATYYYQNGQIEGKMNMVNGNAEGECLAYYPDGKLKMKAIFKNSVKISYKSYDDKGKLEKEFDGTKITDYKNKK